MREREIKGTAKGRRCGQYGEGDEDVDLSLSMCWSVTTKKKGREKKC